MAKKTGFEVDEQGQIDRTGYAPRETHADRNQRGRELAELAERLIAVRDLDAVPLIDHVRQAVLQTRTIRKPKARARQAAYVAKLLKGVDTEVIEAALDGSGEQTAAEEEHFARLERWRRKMLEDDQAIEAFVAEHPAADRQQLRQRVRQARREPAPGKAFKALFKALREASE